MLTEEILNEGRILHLSDAGRMIRQRETGILYENAEDVIPCRYSYEETEELIPADEEAAAADYEEALERLGVEL